MYDIEEPKARVGYAREHARKAFKECAHLFPEGFPCPIEKAIECILPEYTIITLETLPERLDAIVRKEEKLIGINAKHSKVRQRFSIAHELAHLKLQHPEIVYDPDGKKDRIFESEANMFAGEFLVPLKTLKSVIKSVKDPVSLSNHFNVSKDVMFIRLKETRLLKLF